MKLTSPFPSTLFFITILIFGACSPDQKSIHYESIDIPFKDQVKSVLLYHEIQEYQPDTIILALNDVNSVIARIDSKSLGYSLWKVQSDSIQSYRYFIQGEWADQSSYDTIHAHSEFRKVLDKYKSIFDQTRKWDLYRRFERMEN
jgi:hypothetical protein